jgi:type II secretory pathway pseudopilin PulG
MDKKVIYIIGGLAVVGIGYYLYTRNKNKSASATTDATATEGGATKSASAEDGATTPEGATPKAGQNIKDLKGKEKRAYRKDAREVCRDKYGKGKDYRDCLDRVKGGGVAFDGSDIQDEFYSGMTDDFDVSFR